MGNNPPSWRTGHNVIAAAGTAEQCTAAPTTQGSISTFHARSTNAGLLFVGYSKADAEANHFTITPDASIDLQVDNIDDVWVDAEEADDIIEWMYEVATE